MNERERKIGALILTEKNTFVRGDLKVDSDGIVRAFVIDTNTHPNLPPGNIRYADILVSYAVR